MSQQVESTDQVELAAPLSFAQQRLWLLDRLLPTGSVYNISHALRLSGELHPVALRNALNELVRRHEILRTRIGRRDGGPVQAIAPQLEFALDVEELDARTPDERASEARQRARAEARAAFDLERGPLIRARLLRLTSSEHWLLLTLHHIVTDGWSSGVLTRELTALYSAYHRGDASPLAALPVQYADYATWQREWLQGEVLAQQLSYWRQALADVPILDLPTDRPRPALASYQGGRVLFEVPAPLTHALKALSQREGATLFMTLLAAFQVLLYRHSGQEDIVVGVPIAGRTRPELEGLIGFFVNTLVLRGDLSGEPSFREYLARVRTRALDAYGHQDLPFEKLVEELAPNRDLSRNPFFQAVLAFQNTPRGNWQLPGLEVQRLEGITSESAKFDLSMNLTEGAGRLSGYLEYATDLFDPPTIERMAGHFATLLEGIVAHPESAVGKLPLLTSAERHRLLVQWNDTAVDYPRDRCVHQLFEEQAARTPDAVAVVFDKEQLTYHALNARANQLAHHLIGLGVGPEVLVGICLERSLELVIGLLGILKAGGAYVPLDPGYPPARLAFMLEDTRAPVLLTQHRLLGQLHLHAGRTLCLDRDWPTIATHPVSNPSATTTAASLAYVMYTSGSTGTPKGVMIEHRGVCNHLVGLAEPYRLDATDCMLQTSAISFDQSVWQIFVPLMIGARLLLPEPDAHRSPDAVVDLVRQCGVTILRIVPSLLAAIVYGPGFMQCAGLRRVFCGGESLNDELAARFASQSDAQLVNVYGPTETTVCSIYWPYQKGLGRQTIPIGSPIANTSAYVLDAHGEPVPIGTPGELCIGGEGVARGYLGQLALTLERFVADPFSQRPGARMYRTGDRARYLPDGNLEFLGRRDDQVKFRGYRIELGEIEAALAGHGAVAKSAVVVHEFSPGDRRLIAYFATNGDRHATVDELRGFLRRSLPDYMVPAAFVHVDRFPLTSGGKIDRKALPVPEVAAYAGRAYEAPVGEIETALARIWADVLKIERVGRHDHFFELGGHSLLAVTLFERMRQAGLHADVRTLFVTPTLAELATALDSDGYLVAVPPNRIPSGCDAISPEMLPLVQLTSGEIGRVADAVSGGAANIQDIYPLAPLQEGILFHHVMATRGDPYLMSSLFGFDSRTRLERYLQALQAVIDRHDILRTAVLWEGLPEPVQVVWRRAPLAVEEVGIAPAEGDVAEQLRARFDPRHYRLDVRQAPLIRVFIAHDAANARWVMLQLFHHLSSDHTTAEVIQREIQAHLLGLAGELPTPLPFRNFVAQTRLGVSRDEHEAFFRKLLGDVDEPTTPFGLTDVYGDGSGIAGARSLLDTHLAKRLRERARTLGVSAASVCHLAWALVLARVSGRDDVVFGTVLFGRMQAGSGADRVLGPFINTLPIRIRVGDQSVQDGVRHTHAVLGQLLRHEHAPLALAQRCSAVAATAPLFSTLLNYRHTAAAAKVRAEALRGRDGIELLGLRGSTSYPLHLSVDDLDDGFALTAKVQSPIDPQRVCAFMHTALEQLVGALEREPNTLLRDLDLDHAGWQRDSLDREPLGRQLDYWRRRLTGVTPLRLPTDRVRAATGDFDGSPRHLGLSATLTDALRRLSKREGVTMFMTLLAAFQILLARRSGQWDIPVGMPVAGRTRRESEERIGFLANVLVLRTDLSGNPSFQMLLRRVRDVCLGAYANQDLPFEKLVEVVTPARDPSQHPLFDVMLNLTETTENVPGLDGMTGARIALDPTYARFAITLDVKLEADGADLGLVYHDALYSSGRMVELLEQYRHLLTQIAEAPEQTILSFSLVTLAARERLPDPRDAIEEPRQAPVTELFASWAKQQPEAIAVSHGPCQWTYRALADAAQHLAQALADGGVRRGDVVAILGPPSFGLVSSMLGVWLSGGVFLTVDGQLPEARQRVMMREAGAKAVCRIGATQLPEGLLASDAIPAVFEIDPATGMEQCAGVDRRPTDASLPVLDGDAPAYVFFTSGSTGVPKGILGCHKGLSHFLNWQRDAFGIGAQDRVAQLTSLSFDVLLRDVFLPLTCGGMLCIPEEADRLEPLAWLERERVTVLHIVPTLLQSWLAQPVPPVALRTLRWLFVAGEPLSGSLVQAWRDAFPDSAELVNLYGPTETTLAKCFHRVTREIEPGLQPVGLALPQTQALVLNEAGAPCGIGEPGEVVLRTPFRSLGYINAPEQTRARFVSNPFRNDADDLLYCTGDRGRYREDGTLDLLGRLDDQVKIRGVRVEPGEVAAAVSEHPAVKACVVAGRKGERGDDVLVAYVVGNPAQPVTAGELRSFLDARLPAALVPSEWLFLDDLPRLPNGKVDRSALPVPSGTRSADQISYVAPRTPVESRLAEIWRETLGIARIGVNDNFFDVGGHSLKAMQLVSRIRRAFGVELLLRRFFEAPTIAELAGDITRIDREVEASALERILREVELLSDDEAARQLDAKSADA